MILITGATGKTGGAAAKILAEQGAAVRALVRNEEKAGPLREMGVEVVIGDLADPAAVNAALDGVERAFIVAPNGEQQLKLEMAIVEAAKETGVRHLVKMSSMEAAPDASKIPSIHYQCEQYIKGSGLDWTMLKPNFFMQNLFGSAKTIAEQQKIFLPMGDGKTAMADTRDIGAVAAHVLSTDGHAGKDYELTGPEVLTFHDAAERFSEALGKTVEYINVPMDGYRETLKNFLPEWHANAVCDLFAEIADGGGLEYKTDTIKQLLGREPTSLKQFVIDHKALFGG